MSTFSHALALWRHGNAPQAEAICQALVDTPAEGALALSLLAEILASTGREAQAIPTLNRLLQIQPRNAPARRQLGNLLLASGAPREAVASYRQALALEPDNVRAHNNLGQALVQLERLTEAVEHYERAIALDPTYSIAYNNLGIVRQRQGQLADAIASYRRATALQPALAEAHCNCGSALLSANRPTEALRCFTEALALKADFVEALVGRADTLQQLRRFEAALEDYDRALRLRPNHAETLCNRANALLELRRADAALACSERALELRTEFPEAHNNRCGALRELNRHVEALAACDRALALRPDYVEALCNRGKLLREMGEHLSAQESFRQALNLNPGHLEARTILLMSLIPPVPVSDEQVQSSRAAFSQELEGFAEWLRVASDIDETAVVGAAQPFFLAYSELANRQLLGQYGSLCTELMMRWQRRNVPTLPRRGAARVRDRIRIGIVSAYVREHAVFRALTKGWLGRLDPRCLEVGVFHLGQVEDAETQWAKAHAAFFVTGHRTLVEWVDEIGRAAVDVLLYPELGMDPTTLRLASMRLAPLQLAAWGHPETTGLSTIDNYLSAQAFEPPASQAHYCEQLVLLPNLGCYCEPYDWSVPRVDLEKLGIAADRPLILCPGTPFKYAPQHDRVLVEIARRLGRCQLVFFEHRTAPLSRKLRARLDAAFRSKGLEPGEYTAWVPWQSPPEFFALMRRATVCLDTMGFSGFNTALQAVECDLPLVAYEGRFMRGRLASGIMRRMQLQDLVARDEGEYVELATRLAADTAFRSEARARLQAGKHVLFRDDAAVEGLSEFLRTTIRR